MSAFRDGLERRGMGIAGNLPIEPPRLHRSAVHGATLRVLQDAAPAWVRARA